MGPALTLVDEIGEVAGVGGWEFDVATSTCTWSRAVARILELDALTTPLDAFVALQVGDGRAQLAAWLHDATTSGNWFDRELEVRLPSGRHAWVRTTGRFTGGVVRGIIHDVTERRAAQDARRHGEDLLRTFIESSPGRVAMFDRDMRYLAVSRDFASYCGLSTASLLGCCHYDVYPHDPPRWRDAHRRCFGGETVRCVDDPLPGRPGETDWVTWELRPWRDANGAIGGLVLFSELVTERKRREVALRESELQLRALLDTVPLGIALVVRGGGQILSANARCADLFGYPLAELLGRRLIDLTHPDDRPHTRDRVAADQLTGTIELDKRYVRKDGSVMWAHVRITPVIEPDGSAARAVVTVDDITERREVESRRVAERERADAARRESEARLRTALEGMPIPIGLAELDGRGVMYNAEFTARYGYTLEDLPHVRDWVQRAYPAPEIRAAVEAQWLDDMRDIPASGRAQPARVHPTVCKDGRRAHVQIVARRVGGLVLAVFHDVTATVEANAALAESEERQRLALETAELATWHCDFVTGIAELDPRARALFGLDQPIISVAELFSRVHPDDAVDHAAIERAGLAGGGRATRRIVLPNGEQRWISSTARFECAGEGASRRVVRASMIGHDITVERRAEDALRASEERYRTLVDSLEAVIFSVDAAGVVTFVNRAVATFGFRPEDCIGRVGLEFLHPTDQASVHVARGLRQAGQRVGPAEYRIRDASGKPRHVRVMMHEVPGGGLAGVVSDLTTMRATEEQLRAAQKMEAIGRLAGGIAHDFNNLLTVILSYAEIAADTLREEDPLSADLQQIHTAGMRAAGLTRQLLAFSRRQVLQPEAVDLGELVQSLGKMLHRLIGEDIELILRPSPDKAVALVDRGQLEQVVMNLVVNARDAMPDGGRLAIETDVITLEQAAAQGADLPPGRYVRLAVADTGIGMDTETRARVFEPFFTTKELGKGTGLGLSTVFGIVKQSRGGISVTSTPGAGSTFAVFLPVDSDPALPATTPQRSTPLGGHETILVVEDEAPLRAVVVRVLASAGYRVLVAATPSEAIRIAREHSDKIRLIFTDVVMPEMNGRELAARLGPLCPSAQILYTSGYTDDALMRSGVLGQEFLAKPFEPTTLSARIRALLDRPPNHRS